jgi:hypothetical protein
MTLSGLEQTVKSVGQDSIRILPVVYASESELVARRAGVARSPLRAVTCNWETHCVQYAQNSLKVWMLWAACKSSIKARSFNSGLFRDV